MRGFLLLFHRDLQQRWMLFVASFAMGLFIAAIPLLRGSRLSPAELRGAAGLTAALIWCAVLAILLGGSIFTRDLTENRLAFDFRLPVRPSAIWAARLLAAIVTIATAAAVLLTPPAMAGMDWTGAGAGLDEWIGHGATNALAYAPLALLALLLLTHPIALAARTRSGWAGVDVLSVLIVAVSVYVTTSWLLSWEAFQAIWHTYEAMGVLCLLGVLLASLRQLSGGRTEGDSAQRLLSLGLLATALAVSLLLTAASNWLLRPTTRQLADGSIGSRGIGSDWLLIVGNTHFASDVSFRFLVRPNSHRELRLGPYSPLLPGGDPTISLDGSTLAWLEKSSGNSAQLRLYTLDAFAASDSPRRTPVTTQSRIGSWGLSPDGKRFAVTEYVGRAREPQRLLVSTIDSGAVEATTIIPPCLYRAGLFFASPQQVVVPCSPMDEDPQVAESIFRFDVRSKTLSSIAFRPRSSASFEAAFGLFRGLRSWLEFEEGGAPTGGAALKLTDPDSSRVEVTLELPAATRRDHFYAVGRVLKDGRIVLAARIQDGNLLLVFAASGSPQRAIPIREGENTAVLQELPEANSVLIATRDPHLKSSDERWTLSLVDLSSERAATLASGVRLDPWREAGASRSVVRNARGKLLWFNPESRVLQELPIAHAN